VRLFRIAAATGLLLIATALLSGAASAHVTIPDPGEKGGFSIVTFSVPNERPDAGTTTLEVQLPEDYPLPFVSVQPKPGWTAETTMRTLDEPVDAFGEDVTEVVDTVTWSGGEIAPGEFDTFSLSVGPLPEDVESLTFPAIQTYSSDEEVAWIEETPEGGEEPEHPAPVLTLVESETGGTTDGEDATATTESRDDEAAATETEDDDSSSDGLAIAALVIAVLAAILGGAAFVTARRD
jgi:periplasmic copper chaperone A